MDLLQKSGALDTDFLRIALGGVRSCICQMTLMERGEEKVRTVHLGSTRKLSREATRQKARQMKAEALAILLKAMPART